VGLSRALVDSVDQARPAYVNSRGDFPEVAHRMALLLNSVVVERTISPSSSLAVFIPATVEVFISMAPRLD